MPSKKRSRKIEHRSHELTPFTGLRKTQFRSHQRQINSSLFQESRVGLSRKPRLWAPVHNY
jgi:hypothetical protein